MGQDRADEAVGRHALVTAWPGPVKDPELLHDSIDSNGILQGVAQETSRVESEAGVVRLAMRGCFAERRGRTSNICPNAIGSKVGFEVDLPLSRGRGTADWSEF